jgi:hypothetical protein
MHGLCGTRHQARPFAVADERLPFKAVVDYSAVVGKH